MSETLDALIAPLRPHLLPLLHALPAPLVHLSTSLLGPTCHTTLVEHLDLSAPAAPCLSLAISKALGLGIITLSCVVKLPQLAKILRARSGAGLSLASLLLETAAYTITLAYNVRAAHPFSTYGEMALIAVQNVAIALAVLAFAGRGVAGAVLVGAVGVGAGALLAGPQVGAQEVVSAETLALLQAGAGVLGVAAKAPQIWTIWANGGTGQLSAFTVFTFLAGSLARIFTTLKEVDDVLILAGFVAGFALNVVLAAQMVYYWNAGPEKGTAHKAPAQKAHKVAAAPTTGKTTGAAAKKGSTRRRG